MSTTPNTPALSANLPAQVTLASGHVTGAYAEAPARARVASLTGQNQIWFMSGATLVSALAATTMSDVNWKVTAIGDFDGDGKSDILWHNGVTGRDAVFLMNGATLVSLTFLDTVPAPPGALTPR